MPAYHNDHYNLAVLYTLIGSISSAIEYLSMLPKTQLRYVKNDPVFAALREEPKVRRLLPE